MLELFVRMYEGFGARYGVRGDGIAKLIGLVYYEGKHKAYSMLDSVDNLVDGEGGHFR